MATQLVIDTEPTSTAVAGVDFDDQPVVEIQDQFGNLEADDDSTVITVTNTGATVLEGVTNVTVAGGIASFAGLDYTVAETIQLGFEATNLTGATSGNIVVSAAPASQVTVVTQPSATATAGINFAQQPVVQVQDQYGNLVKTDNSTMVTASIDQGSDVLVGPQTVTAANGVVSFANLSYQTAETITIDFTASGLDMDTSSNIVVGAAPASQLVILTQPSAGATAGVPFAQQPVVWVKDQFGNHCATNNSTVVTASRNAGSGSGALQGTLTATANAGLATFASLSHNVATSISIDFNSSGLTGATSSNILINAASVSKLAFTTQPGSATVGSIFGTQPAVITQDAFGNNSVSGLANSLSVTMALTSGTGTLQGTTNLNIGTGAGNGTVTFGNLEIDSAGSKQLTANASGLTGAVSSSFTVAQGSQTITFGSLPNKTYGVAPFAVSAGASSGLPITFSIVTGPASVSGSNVTITGAGSVTVRASQPGNADYTAATPVDQSFTVSKAGTSVSVSSSKNPSGFKDSVTFMANLPADATGSVTFLTNSVALSTNSLGSGSATSATTTLLPRGTNAVAAQYAGDGNYIGSTNSLLVGQIVTNHPPVAGVATYTRTAGLRLLIAKSDLTNYWTDADGDTVTLTGINLVTTNNVNLATNATFIFYTNSPNVNDQISYTIRDSMGDENFGLINIVVNPFVTGQQTGAVAISGNSANVAFYAIPGYAYVTQRATNLMSATWVDISTNTTATNGVLSVTDNFNDLGGNIPASAYYRLKWSP